MSLSIALFQPDIPGNCGTILRLAACLDLQTHIIEPAGFDLSDRALKRAAMDYLAKTHLQKHADWHHFQKWQKETRKRLVLLTTKSSNIYTDFSFQPNDILLFGRESAGVPQEVFDYADACITIPMKADARSLNIALSVAMTVGEAQRQIRNLGLK